MRLEAHGVRVVAEGFQSPQLLLLQSQTVGVHLHFYDGVYNKDSRV